jgi:formamidopyrimidine-DNA glycosylase
VKLLPELPEVETVRAGLEAQMVGQRISKVLLRRDGLRFPFPENMEKRMVGAEVGAVERRAKYLIIRLNTADDWLVHLGMSGYFSLVNDRGSIANYEPLKHDHVLVEFENGFIAVYNDTRRFGVMDLFPAGREDEHRLISHLGPEPLSDSWDARVLAKSLSRRKTAIKVALLDQKVVVGVGNIYASEALFRARISPLDESAKIVGKNGINMRSKLLVSEIKKVLREAIAAGGSTLKDFKSVDGTLGYFAHSFKVYGREGEACVTNTCVGEVERIVQGGRSTFYCPVCQKK